MMEQNQERVRQLILEAVNRAIVNHGIEISGGKQKKPEHMTHLRGETLVCKDHPRIIFRGKIDSLESEIILVQTKAKAHALRQLDLDLEEIIKTIRHLLRCEVSGENVGEIVLQGLDETAMREHSHHPSQYYGRKHFLPTAEHGEIVASLNRLRTATRETELAAYKAFQTEQGEVSRVDIIRTLNRLSSLFWIMMFKYLAGEYRVDETIEVEASGRHVHLSRKDVDALFGVGYQLTKAKDLSQPGQYACKERVSITGPKGTIENVVVLGPERKETQIEVSFTDGLALGIHPPIRQSGEVADTPGAVLSNGERKLSLEHGVIVSKRHIHVAKEDANRLGVKDNDVVSIEILSKRPVIFQDTVVRVSEDYATYVHIDYDEANACGFEKGTRCKIVR